LAGVCDSKTKHIMPRVAVDICEGQRPMTLHFYDVQMAWLWAKQDAFDGYVDLDLTQEGGRQGNVIWSSPQRLERILERAERCTAFVDLNVGRRYLFYYDPEPAWEMPWDMEIIVAD